MLPILSSVGDISRVKNRAYIMIAEKLRVAHKHSQNEKKRNTVSFYACTKMAFT